MPGDYVSYNYLGIAFGSSFQGFKAIDRRFIDFISRLAYAEIYKGIAGLARRFDFELHDTTMEDMKVVGERVFTITRRGQIQMYVTVSDLAKM